MITWKHIEQSAHFETHSGVAFIFYGSLAFAAPRPPQQQQYTNITSMPTGRRPIISKMA
jgi:hypothetical protein